MKFLRYLLFSILFLFLTTCNRPQMMDFEVIFYTTLGTNYNEIGSNYEELKKFYKPENDYRIGDNLDVSTEFDIKNNKLYIADKYNNRISVFNLNSLTNNLIMLISNQNEDYRFGTPFMIKVNKYGEIYVVVSISNYSFSVHEDYESEEELSVETNDIILDEEVEIEKDIIEELTEVNPTPVKKKKKDQEITNENPEYLYKQYYIYKFSADGKYIYTIGENGLNTGPLPFPYKIDIDMYDNLYVYIKDYNQNDKEEWTIKRFSSSGELNFEFNTGYLDLSEANKNNVYDIRISDLINLKNDEKILIYTEKYQKIKDGNIVINPSDIIVNIDMYSVLLNKINRNIIAIRNFKDFFLNTTVNDELVMYSYDEKISAIKISFYNILGDEITVENYYSSLFNPLQNILLKYFVSDDGQIYSLYLKDNRYYTLLKWKKNKNKV